MRYDLVDVINQILGDYSRSSISNSVHSDSPNENGHLIISLKFFKFFTDEDAYKEQREVEIIRTVSFIDIEGFNSTYTQALMNKKNLSLATNPKNYSLLQFKNLIDSIASQDIEKYSEVKSLICSLTAETLKIQNSTFFFFGFVDQNGSSILESTVTLEFMNSFMKMTPDYFFELVQDVMLINNSGGEENENLKEEFHKIDTIFSEIIFYIERTSKGVNFNKSFYYSIRDLSQQERYEKLKTYLLSFNINLELSILKNIYSAVQAFFVNRSKWRNLTKAYEEIIKINSSFKEETPKNTMKEGSVNESDELRVFYIKLK